MSEMVLGVMGGVTVASSMEEYGDCNMQYDWWIKLRSSSIKDSVIIITLNKKYKACSSSQNLQERASITKLVIGDSGVLR
jgi:hypothetical protein